MTALLSVTLLICLPAAKGKARLVALSERGVEPAASRGDGTWSNSAVALNPASRSENTRRPIRFLWRHTNAVLAHKCLPQHGVRPRTRSQARLWHRLSHRAKRGTCIPPIPHKAQWLCIHGYEGSWTDDGAPHWGGLQMDVGFMTTYGTDFIRRFHGYANRWPAWAQMVAAERAYRGVDWRGSTWPGFRGFTPWPNTARMCGLL